MKRVPIDLSGWAERARQQCFICEVVRGTHEYPHRVVYEDHATLAFLNRYPTLLGQTLVVPKEHREAVTGDYSEDEYLELQRVVYRVGEALRATVPTERLYVLSLGSRAANRHVHWHVAALPPGIPFEDQQLEALRLERGVLEVPVDEVDALAERLRAALG